MEAIGQKAIRQKSLQIAWLFKPSNRSSPRLKINIARGGHRSRLRLCLPAFCCTPHLRQSFKSDFSFLFSTLFLSTVIFPVFLLLLFVNPAPLPAASQQQKSALTRPHLPGKINKIGFWAFAANLEPETAARFRSQILNPAPQSDDGYKAEASATSVSVQKTEAARNEASTLALPAPATAPVTALQPFFSGPLDSSNREALASEIKLKFSLEIEMVRLLRQGTFVLTWQPPAAATGAATPNEALTQTQSQPAEQPQKNPTVTTRRLTLPHIEPPLVGFFYDESETLSRPQASFFTYSGKKHRVWLSLPSADTPPGREIILWVYQSLYQPELEPFFDEKKPESCEFTGKIELPSEGSYLVALIGADDAAYFLCFSALAVGQDYDLSLLTPVLLSRAEPVYPESAREKRATGRVKLQSKTGLDGRVNRIRILESVDPILTRAAVEAVSQWVYALPEFEGRKISYVFSVTVDYKLSPPIFDKWGRDTLSLFFAHPYF